MLEPSAEEHDGAILGIRATVLRRYTALTIVVYLVNCKSHMTITFALNM